MTVAVLPLVSATANKASITLQAADVDTDWFSGTGKGGQHRNKHQNSCRLTHKPTGIVTTSQCRKRTQSFDQAWSELERRVQALHRNSVAQATSTLRSQLTGSGMRADKVRTYRFQDDQVKDHQSGKSAKASQIMRGQFDKLY